MAEKVLVGPWFIWIQRLQSDFVTLEGNVLYLGYLRESQFILKPKKLAIDADNAPAEVAEFGLGLEDCNFTANVFEQSDLKHLAMMIGAALTDIDALDDILDLSFYGESPVFRLMACRPLLQGWSWSPAAVALPDGSFNKITKAKCDVAEFRVCVVGEEGATLEGKIDDANTIAFLAKALSKEVHVNIPAKLAKECTLLNLLQSTGVTAEAILYAPTEASWPTANGALLQSGAAFPGGGGLFLYET